MKMKKLTRIIAIMLATFPLWAMNGGPVIKSYRQDGNGFVVRAVHVDEFGVKWFGTSEGLLRYDGKEWFYKHRSWPFDDKMRSLPWNLNNLPQDRNSGWLLLVDVSNGL